MFSYPIAFFVIICASRRTDIPAFHSEWLMNRLRAGYALVRNPIRKDVVYKVDLSPKNVDLLLLMTKDPRPMVPHMDELLSYDIKCGFQVSITPYGRDIEPGVKDKAGIAEAFRVISERIRKENMIWRYDPVILNGRFDINYHKRKFEVICRELSGYTERCIFSFVDIHDKLKHLHDDGIIRNVPEDEARGLGEVLAPIAYDHNIQLNICCSEYDLSDIGIFSRGCIDKDHMRSIGVPFEEMSTPLREGCRCVRNIDIGEYDTCDHDCIYCYANRNTTGSRKSRVYDPENELLYGSVNGSDRIVELASRKVSKITDF